MIDFDQFGRPVSVRYRVPYCDASDPWNTAHSCFVDGAQLRPRWRGRRLFTVLELGFGLGVNFLATLDAWMRDPSRPTRLVFVSIEDEALSAIDLRRAHDALGIDSAQASTLRDRWPMTTPGLHRIAFFGGSASLILAFGAAETLLAKLDTPADAFYLDGFAPALNPGMWNEAVMRNLARLARPDAVAAARTGARPVRAALARAGFSVETHAPLASGDATISARFDPHRRATVDRPRRTPASVSAPRRAIVVGAGVCGCAVAGELGARGWDVQLLECGPSIAGPGSGSGQQVLADHPHLSPDDNRLARLSRAAISLSNAHDLDTVEVRARPPVHARPRERGPDAPGGIGGEPLGRLVVAADEAGVERQRQTLDTLRFPDAFVRHLDRERASSLAGIELATGGLWFPGCRALDPLAQCEAWIERAAAAVAIRTNVAVAALERRDGQWNALDANGAILARAPVAILANAGDAPRLGRQAVPGLRRLRGQSTVLDPGILAGLRTVVGAGAFACPLPDGRVVVGSTFDDGDSVEPSIRADESNLRRLAAAFAHAPPPFSGVLATVAKFATLATVAAVAANAHANSRAQLSHGALGLSGWRSGPVGFRWVTRDRIPMIGALPDEAATRARLDAHMRDDRIAFALHEGLYGAFAFGSRGLLWARLAAEILGATLDDEPIALETDLLASLDPARFLRHAVRRARL